VIYRSSSNSMGHSRPTSRLAICIIWLKHQRDIRNLRLSFGLRKVTENTGSNHICANLLEYRILATFQNKIAFRKVAVLGKNSVLSETVICFESSELLRNKDLFRNKKLFRNKWIQETFLSQTGSEFYDNFGQDSEITSRQS
jgi:hypothetical protein